MNTTAHMLLAGAALARPGQSRVNWAVMAGAFLPDSFMFVMIFIEGLIFGKSGEIIFRQVYWQEPWQTIFAITNAIPIYGALALVAYMFRYRALLAFNLAAMLQCVTDLPLHHDDGHPHFWPFTDWVYASPVSYWDAAHYGTCAGVALALLCLGLGVVLWRRFPDPWIRGLILLTVLAEFSISGLWKFSFT